MCEVQLSRGPRVKMVQGGGGMQLFVEYNYKCLDNKDTHSNEI